MQPDDAESGSQLLGMIDLLQSSVDMWSHPLFLQQQYFGFVVAASRSLWRYIAMSSVDWRAISASLLQGKYGMTDH